MTTDRIYAVWSALVVAGAARAFTGCGVAVVASVLVISMDGPIVAVWFGLAVAAVVYAANGVPGE